MKSWIAVTLTAILVLLSGRLSAQNMEKEIKKIAEKAKGHVGVGLYLVESKRSVWMNKDDHFPMQSVYKFPIGMAVLAKVDAGEIGLDEMVTVQKSDLIGPAQHSPIRDKHPEGNFQMSVRELLYYAVSESDGSASDVLMRRIGEAKQVMKFLKRIGICNISVMDTEYEIGRNDTVQYRNWATPSDAIKLLNTFYKGKGLKPGSRELLMKMMTETETGMNRLKGLLPKDAAVAHKTGSSRTVNGKTAATNDIGIISLPNGKHLLAAVFVSDSQANDSVREEVIAKIARLGWDKLH
ncbi:MAG: class A beta-lactamase, subclass A2 [Bacteroidota bacterium]|nr:class A beta-lactamase, subclass A2 [Bacteroidota bacterium]